MPVRIRQNGAVQYSIVFVAYNELQPNPRQQRRSRHENRQTLKQIVKEVEKNRPRHAKGHRRCELLTLKPERDNQLVRWRIGRDRSYATCRLVRLLAARSDLIHGGFIDRIPTGLRDADIRRHRV